MFYSKRISFSHCSQNVGYTCYVEGSWKRSSVFLYTARAEELNIKKLNITRSYVISLFTFLLFSNLSYITNTPSLSNSLTANLI